MSNVIKRTMSYETPGFVGKLAEMLPNIDPQNITSHIRNGLASLSLATLQAMGTTAGAIATSPTIVAGVTGGAALAYSSEAMATHPLKIAMDNAFNALNKFKASNPNDTKGIQAKEKRYNATKQAWDKHVAEIKEKKGKGKKRTTRHSANPSVTQPTRPAPLTPSGAGGGGVPGANIYKKKKRIPISSISFTVQPLAFNSDNTVPPFT